VQTTCTIAEFVTNDGAHPLRLLTAGQEVVSHLAHGVSSVSSRVPVGKVAAHGSSVVWTGFQIKPGTTEPATLRVSFTPASSELGSRVALFTGVEANALDATAGAQVHGRFGTLSTSGEVIQKP
jgi:hypothetical protein